jgi:flagellar protein FliO/FliZ
MHLKFLTGYGLMSLPARACAAQTDTGNMLTVWLSLLLILGGFVLVAWLARRYLPGVGKQGIIKVVGATMVGPRERVVLVEVDNTWLVLGVGAGQVRLLDKRDKPAKPISPVTPMSGETG